MFSEVMHICNPIENFVNEGVTQPEKVQRPSTQQNKEIRGSLKLGRKCNASHTILTLRAGKKR